MQHIILFLNRVNRVVGSVCALLMLLMMLNVFVDVLMRYWFNNPSIAFQELEWHLFAAMFMLGIGYTFKENGHVRVDIFYERFSAKTQALINILGIVICVLPFAGLMVYFGIDFVGQSFSMSEGSADPGGLPMRWLVKAVIPCAFGFLILSAFTAVLEQITVLKPPAKTIGTS